MNHIVNMNNIKHDFIVVVVVVIGSIIIVMPGKWKLINTDSNLLGTTPLESNTPPAFYRSNLPIQMDGGVANHIAGLRPTLTRPKSQSMAGMSCFST